MASGNESVPDSARIFASNKYLHAARIVAFSVQCLVRCKDLGGTVRVVLGPSRARNRASL